MEQTTSRPKRPRPTSLQINVPRVKPIAELSTASYSGVVASGAKTMSYNYQRPRDLSPGGRRLQNPGRLSDNTLTDPYYSQRHGSYASPRSSGVIPISTQIFVNTPPSTSTTTSGSSSRADPRYDSYSGRPRRSSLVDTTRGSSSTTQLPARTRPNVIQQDIARPSSPNKPTQPIQPSREYYVVPASSQEPRTNVSTHKKLYSVDDGGAKLVADVNIPVQAGGERQHKRRDSVERSGYRNTERDRGGRGYHVNGTNNKSREKSIEDEDAYSYTDPASMYRDTEPRWRDTRTRRGSTDRSGGISRERPTSVLDPTFGTRQTAKEVGPPPSTRGWDKINEIGRARSVRETPREVAQSPTRGRVHQEPGAYGDPRDPYYVPPRTSSTDRRATMHSYDVYDYDNREPRRPERRHSITRDQRTDKSVERRGFGIRTDFRNESQTRYTGREGRGSDESFEAATYRDSGYGEPHRRETAPGFVHQDTNRLGQEKRDREPTQHLQVEDYGRSRPRGYSDTRDYSREPRRREDDRAYDQDYERPHERDRSRADRPADRERERNHHRRDTDRDRDYGRRDASPRQSGENVAKPGLAQAATGGLAGAAAAFGLTNLINKVTDKRDKDKEDYQDRDRERDSDRERRRERERERDRNERSERRNGEDRDYPRERRQAASDEYEEQDRHKDTNPGLGFAFEASEPPRSAPPTNAEFGPDRKPEWNQPSQGGGQAQARNQEHDGQRDLDRDRSRDNNNNKPYEAKPTVEMPAAAIDPDEDYRRRMEQVQRELGRTSDEQRASDSDADRERRRREREQRQRDREIRSGVNASAGVEGGFHDPHQNFRDDLSSYASTVGTDLKRKPSILDQPMTDEPDQMAHIIDNSMSDKRENRVRIVDPPTEEEERRPKGILKKPTEKFPEDLNAVREGVAPLKDATKKGIPPGARWTKIDRRLVNPEALEAAHERFEERLDCVIVLRVLTKEEIQKLADRTREIRDRRYEEERAERKASRRSDRNQRRHLDDEYEHSDSEDEFKQKAPKMLEAPSTAGTSSNADFIRENRDRRNEREREAEPSYMSGGLGRRDESQARY